MTNSSGTDAATIYLRISLDKTGEGLGVERQEAECRALCERNGWAVHEVLTDNDISATSGKVRPSFERLLTSKPERIVVWHIDRLVRLSKDLERVLDLGVNVYAVASGQFDLSNPAGRAVARTVTAWSQYEGEQKAERQKAAARQRAKAGRSWWPQRPFGFERDGSHRPEEVEALRTAYGDVLAGKPLMRIADELTRSGFTTNRGLPWRATSLRPVLLNARNAGIRVYEGEEIGPAAWEAIVPEETYRAAVRSLSDPKRKVGGNGRRSSLLTGIVTCGVCDGPVRKAWRGRKGDVGARAIYVCKVNHVSKPMDELDSIVAGAAIARMTLPHAHRPFSLSRQAKSDAAPLREEEATLRQRLDELATDRAEGLITRQQMVTGTEHIRARLEVIEAELAEIGDVSQDGEMSIAEVADHFFELDTDRQRQVITQLFPSIKVHGRGRGVRTWQRGGSRVRHCAVARRQAEVRTAGRHDGRRRGGGRRPDLPWRGRHHDADLGRPQRPQRGGLG
ncbi:recombinase family protein [Georgenia sp. SUBG003]|uniref:recombinase family protein n=1 Tax=Georgenia sp. SUBG003 TaxID=1497974 RepID=UPI0006934FBA